MIDAELKRAIERNARTSFEEIYSDWVAGTEDGIGSLSDAVEPTTWQMTSARYGGTKQEQTIRILAGGWPAHPDQKEFLEIVRGALSGYFTSEHA